MAEFRITEQPAGLQMQKYVSRSKTTLAQLLVSATIKLHILDPLTEYNFEYAKMRRTDVTYTRV